MRSTVKLARVCAILVVAAWQLIAPPEASAQGLRGQLQSLWQRAVGLYDAGRYAEAEETARRSIALSSRVLGPRHRATARGRYELARIIGRLGRVDEAEKLVREAIDNWTAEFGPQSAEVAAGLTMLGWLLIEQDKYAESHEVLARALRNLEVSKPRSPTQRGGALRWIGIAHFRQGNLGEAETMLRKALAAQQNLTGADVIHRHRTEGNLGFVLWMRGRLSEAEQYLKRAITGYERLGLPARAEFANVIERLASFYVGQDRLDEADALLKRALALHQATSGAGSHLSATTLELQGLLDQERERLPQAVAKFRAALEIRRKVRGDDHMETALTLSRLGEALVLSGKLDEAEPLLQRALALRREKDGSRHYLVARLHLALGRLHLARKDFARSQSEMDTGLDIVRETLGESHIAMARALRQTALLYQQSGRHAEALAALQQASNLVHRRHSAVDNPAFASPTAEVSPRLRRDINNRIVDIAGSMRAAAGRTPEPIDLAFVAGQRARSTSAATAVAQMAARFSAENSELATLLRRTQDLSHQRNRLDRQIVQSIGKETGDLEPSGARDRRQVHADVARLEKELSAVAETLQGKFPNYMQLIGQEPLSIRETQSLLAPGEAVVAFHVGPRATTVWAVSASGAAWHRVELTRQQVVDAVDKLRCGLEVDAWADANRRARCKALGLALEAVRLPFDTATAHELYVKLLAPLESVIAGSSLFIVPSGALNALPFHVLLTAAPTSTASASPEALRQAPWLIRRHAMTVMPSVQSLRLLRGSPGSSAPRAFIGIGAPIFSREAPSLPGGNRALATPKERARPGATKGTEAPLGGAGFESLRLGLKPLPETRHELEFIAGQLKSPVDEIMLGSRASEAAIKRSALDSYRIVYFATHALIEGEVAGLGEPALALTLPDKPSPEDDGLLTASEIARLKLNADWVVLSACNTAAGQWQGAEALSGLARAFFYAGTRSLLVSHWKVDSEAAVKLTTATFAALAADPTLSRGDALGRAMLALADSPNAEEAHPAYWAPFFVVGDSQSRGTATATSANGPRLPARSP